MTDNRFPTPGTDARFPSPGTDVRFADAGIDGRFLDGVDTRFEGDTYGGAQIITATVDPTADAMFDGETVGDITNFATLDNTGNYASSEGTIASVQWLVDGVDRAGTYELSVGEAIVLRVTDSAANTRDWTIDASVAAVVPAQFGTGDWSLANDGVDVTLTVTTLPDDGGSALTDLEYAVNGGSYTSLGAATTGGYTITAVATDTVTLRAVNAVGNGTASASKTVPAAAAELPALAYDVRLELYKSGVLFTDTGGTTAATAGDAVALATDETANANDSEQGTVSKRPTMRTSGGVTYLEFDGTDDTMVIAADASWNQTGQSVIMVIKQTTTDALAILGNAGASDTDFSGILDTGSAVTDAVSNSDVEEYYKNGTFLGYGPGSASSPKLSRGDLGAAFQTGDWVIYEAAIMDMTNELQSQGAALFGWRQFVSFLDPVDLGCVLILPTSVLDTGTNRADVVSALATKFGITI